jgi:PASTA domain
MAPAPAASPPARRKGLDLGHPGAKEYLIVGGSALGLALLYFWWKNREAGTTTAAAAAAPASTAAAPASPTGMTTSAFWHWVSDHQSSVTVTGKVAVPSVTGDQYAAAAKKITAAGLTPHRAEPSVGKVTSQFPRAGTKVADKSVVVLSGSSTPAATTAATPGKKKPDAGGKSRKPTKKKPVIKS